MDYSTLISNLVSNTGLYRNVAIDILSNPSYLNLTAADWETQLENNVSYQYFCNISKGLWKPPCKNENYCYQESKIPNFNVIVIGYCKFAKPYNGKISNEDIYVSNCDPLNKIARAMTSDFCPSIPLSNEFKFKFDKCSRLTFHMGHGNIDSGYSHTMDLKNHPFNTNLFDGHRVFKAKQSLVLSQTFLAVMFLQINGRYSYVDSNNKEDYHLFGSISNIIAFDESELKLNFGPMVKCPEKLQEDSDLDKQPTKPSIRKMKGLLYDGFCSGLIQVIKTDDRIQIFEYRRIFESERVHIQYKLRSGSRTLQFLLKYIDYKTYPIEEGIELFYTEDRSRCQFHPENKTILGPDNCKTQMLKECCRENMFKTDDGKRFVLYDTQKDELILMDSDESFNVHPCDELNTIREGHDKSTQLRYTKLKNLRNKLQLIGSLDIDLTLPNDEAEFSWKFYEEPAFNDGQYYSNLGNILKELHFFHHVPNFHYDFYS